MDIQRNMSENEFDIFIEGEVIDLCVPSDAPWVMDQWYKWFNDSKVTKNIDHGIFPNTREKQRSFFQSFAESNERIVLLIRPKGRDYFVGVANLSNIDYSQRQCDFAMVIGKQDSLPDSIYYAMETKCRMTEHAFRSVGVERINSGQVMDLIRWQRWQILFGYQIEGISRARYRKGNTLHDMMISACLLEDYLKISEIRNGSFWPGKAKVFELMKKLPKDSAIDRLNAFLLGERANMWDTYQFDL